MSNRKKIYRSRSDRFLFGVCGGIAQYFEIDTIIVRLIFLALFIGGGSGLIVYLICAILIPAEEQKSENKIIDGEEISEKKKIDWSVLLGLIFILLGFILLTDIIFGFRIFRFFWITFWPLLLIFIGLLILFRKK
ncbi:MAG: PspC domain-containing protein [Patescibacteria group bacterium]|jgi:phage shock protein C